ncbi:hypothetical protein O5D80_001836 [Batrachochytrium dendrobatidis]|nr:hypothetical protein O5D80_001836 [Batrachochytrium dendrobatidis]
MLFTTLVRKSLVSTANKKPLHYLVYVKDCVDKEAYSRRLAARPKHLADAHEQAERGIIVLGGALMSEKTAHHESAGRMTGSMLILDVPDLATAHAVVANDVYTRDRVWDPQQTVICEFKCAPHFKMGMDTDSKKHGSAAGTESTNTTTVTE